MHKKIILLFYLINIFNCFAQTDYTTAIDTGNTAYRAELKALYNERSARTLLSFKNLQDKRVNKVLTESYKEINSEFIDKINDGHFIKASVYEKQINALFKQITDANPQYPALASSRILLAFDNSPNASAIGDGFLIINLPLIAHLKQEHELAFIICHELAHNLLNHPQAGLMEYAKITSSREIKQQTREIEKKKYNRAENSSGLYRKIIYANRKRHRQVEFQADSLGFILYRNAFARKESIALETFTTLESIDKEKDSLRAGDYEKLFSSDRQPFKKEWISGDEISMYKYDKTLKFWQIDSLKTHPDCVDRASRLKTLFNIKSDNEFVADANFQNMIMHAKYDQILGLYLLKEYGESFYQALILLKDNPDSGYLNNIIYYNLAKIQEAKNNYTMNKYVEIVNPRYSYSYNTFLSFLRQLRKSEMAEIVNQYLIKI